MTGGVLSIINPLSGNPTKWPNTLKQCLTVFDHFVGLALKGLTWTSLGKISSLT